MCPTSCGSKGRVTSSIAERFANTLRVCTVGQSHCAKWSDERGVNWSVFGEDGNTFWELNTVQVCVRDKLRVSDSELDVVQIRVHGLRELPLHLDFTNTGAFQFTMLRVVLTKFLHPVFGGEHPVRGGVQHFLS
jgi:hypothetical protein